MEDNLELTIARRVFTFSRRVRDKLVPINPLAVREPQPFRVLQDLMGETGDFSDEALERPKKTKPRNRIESRTSLLFPFFGLCFKFWRA